MASQHPTDSRVNSMFCKKNKVWTTDITYIWTKQGWMYLAVVIDLYSRRVIGWSIDDHMRESLCMNALKMAYHMRKPAKGLIYHSDQGSQYKSCKHRKQLKKFGMICSMSRKGNCWDNAPTERFFRSLKHEYLNYQKLNSKNDAKLSTLDSICDENHKRPHSTLGGLSPMDFEGQLLMKAA